MVPYRTMALTNFEVEHLAKLLGITNLNSVCLQEELKEKKLKDGAYIVNYGTYKNGGTHYVCVLIEANSAFHFDSFGAKYSDDVADFIKPKDHIAYNQFIMQDLDSSLCGWYCLGLIYYLKKNKGKLPLFARCNEYINLFKQDNTKNGAIVRQLFHHWLPKKKTPKRLFDILAKK